MPTNKKTDRTVPNSYNNDHTNGELLRNQVYTTPTKNSIKAVSSDASHDSNSIRVLNNGSPTPTRGLYHRSGRENAMSTSSTATGTTTGTSILGFGREGFGRENSSGGPTILERRRARQENRDHQLLDLDHGADTLPRTP